MPWCKLGQTASRFPEQSIVGAGQLHTMKRTPVARRASARLRPAQRLGGSGDSHRRVQGRSPGVALHHGCTTSVGQEGSSEVTFGQTVMAVYLRFHAFGQVGGVACTDLIMLRPVVRFHLAPPVKCLVLMYQVQAPVVSGHVSLYRL